MNQSFVTFNFHAVYIELVSVVIEAINYYFASYYISQSGVYLDTVVLLFFGRTYLSDCKHI